MKPKERKRESEARCLGLWSGFLVVLGLLAVLLVQSALPLSVAMLALWVLLVLVLLVLLFSLLLSLFVIVCHCHCSFTVHSMSGHCRVTVWSLFGHRLVTVWSLFVTVCLWPFVLFCCPPLLSLHMLTSAYHKQSLVHYG